MKKPTPTRKVKAQIVVTCDKCRDVLAFSDEMPQEEAEQLKRRLTMSVFGAPRCKKCRNIEPYSDISMMHTTAVLPYNKNVKIGAPLSLPKTSKRK